MDRTLFEAMILPHRSLSVRGQCALLGILGSLLALGAVAFIQLGAWPVGGSLASVPCRHLFFRWRARQAVPARSSCSERELRIIPPSERQPQQRTLTTAWLNVHLEERAGQAPAFFLAGHGHHEILAAELGEAQRRDLPRPSPPPCTACAMNCDNPILRDGETAPVSNNNPSPCTNSWSPPANRRAYARASRHPWRSSSGAPRVRREAFQTTLRPAPPRPARRCRSPCRARPGDEQHVDMSIRHQRESQNGTIPRRHRQLRQCRREAPGEEIRCARRQRVGIQDAREPRAIRPRRHPGRSRDIRHGRRANNQNGRASEFASKNFKYCPTKSCFTNFT
jgi:uncharacterized membrane protein